MDRQFNRVKTFDCVPCPCTSSVPVTSEACGAFLCWQFSVYPEKFSSVWTCSKPQLSSAFLTTLLCPLWDLQRRTRQFAEMGISLIGYNDQLISQAEDVILKLKAPSHRPPQWEVTDEGRCFWVTFWAHTTFSEYSTCFNSGRILSGKVVVFFKF